MSSRWRDDDRLTVWILLTALSVGGSERTAIALANRLDPERYDVVVWTLFDTNPLAEQLEVPHRSLGVRPSNPDSPEKIDGAANPLDYVRAPLQFLRQVRRERPEVLHTFLYYDNLVARGVALACRDGGSVPAVVNGVRGYHQDDRPVAHTVDRLTLPLADAVVSNSQGGAEYLRERGLGEERLAVVPNGRDLDAYRDGSCAGLREEFGIPDGGPVVGTVGRLIERKGQFDLLRAWPRISANHPDATLVVVGYGPERGALESLAAELGVAASVRFVGARDDVPAVLDLLDVFAFPSHWEGQPGAVLEAMAAGLPIVATEIDGTTELLTDGETGVLVPPREPSALAAAVDALLSDPERMAALGRAARAAAYEQFSLRSMVAEFEQLYRTVTGRHQSVPSAALRVENGGE